MRPEDRLREAGEGDPDADTLFVSRSTNLRFVPRARLDRANGTPRWPPVHTAAPGSFPPPRHGT